MAPNIYLEFTENNILLHLAAYEILSVANLSALSENEAEGNN